ncbi:serine/threonine-protein kinase [Ostreiculturibacter nitratireducens]|uniref:serine/threonine-protein kinase n=1 Tax=Ostreiculturibacter nitratireducens TaxID=3075226 RepID=UPI0031B61B9D
MSKPQEVVAETAVQEDFVDELPVGTKLLKGQYTISRYLNHGGFGITYQAKDSLDRDVVIKECFPGSFCRRSATIVGARSRAHQAEFRSIVKLFVQEARNLSKLVHPNIVGVHQVFEDNDTAYMAIDYVKGRDLLDMIEDPEVTFAPDAVVSITRKMLGAVGFVHENGILHRDISPDNILVNAAGEPILIDFGAAREEASRASRALTALRVVKDGYSPQEFYIAGSEQGPWSDLYALGASITHLVSGQPPANSQVRLAAIAEGKPDPYEALAGRFEGYPPGFLEAIDKVMNTIPKNRIQSAKEWLAMLDGSAAPLAEARPVSKGGVEPAAPNKEVPAPKAKVSAEAKKGGKGLMIGVAAVAVVAVIGVAVTMTGREPAAAATAPTAKSVAAPAGAPKKEEPAAAPKKVAAAPSPVAPAKAVAAPAEPKTAAASSAPAPTVTKEAAASAQPAAPAPETPAESSTAASAVAPAQGQISYALWDVKLPFDSNIRTVGSTRFAQVRSIGTDADPALTESWLKIGTMIFSVNGKTIADSADLGSQILTDMKTAKGGALQTKLRVKIPGASAYDNVELAVPAIRRIGLANTISLESRMADGAWETVTTGVDASGKSELRAGDILLRETTTGTVFDTADAAERLMDALVGRGIADARLEVLRGEQRLSVRMALVPAS